MITALLDIENDHVYWPDAAERREIAADFEERGVPGGCVGIVDGCLIVLAGKPGETMAQTSSHTRASMASALWAFAITRSDYVRFNMDSLVRHTIIESSSLPLSMSIPRSTSRTTSTSWQTQPTHPSTSVSPSSKGSTTNRSLVRER